MKDETNYFDYFAPEINILNKKAPKELYENFENKRKCDYNSNPVYKMIQDDLIDDFISYLAQTNLNLNLTIKPSIFETNSFLIGKNPNLIEYAAFFGSIQIFNYLKMNEVKLSKSLSLYAIHSNNPEIIHILESKTEFENSNFIELYEEAIKCHHNDIALYIHDNFITSEQFHSSLYALKYYNIELINENFLNNEEIFYYYCKYDYYFPVKILIYDMNINLNIKYTVNQILFK